MTTLETFYHQRTLPVEYLNNVDTTRVYDPKASSSSHFSIVFIGEAPGAHEVEQGIPFVGQAGHNLRKLITSANLSSSWIISNAFPFRTFKQGNKGIINRTPSQKELILGMSLLAKELSIITPKHVILLGRSAYNAFLHYPDPSITHVVKNLNFGEIVHNDSLPFSLGFIYHPSPLMYNRPHERHLMEEFFSKLGL